LNLIASGSEPESGNISSTLQAIETWKLPRHLMNLKELAETMNLSQTTVSRALNGYPEVSEATRRRVTEAAAKFGYRPDPRARTLATGRSMSIGHIIPMSRQNDIANIVFADFIAGAGAVYSRHGYRLVLQLVEDEQELSAYRSIAERGAVDGVIVQSPTSDDPRIAHLSDLGVPFVVHGRASQVKTPYAWLDVNNTRAIAEATCHLIGLGHRRIALVNGQERMDFAQRRRAGFRQALQEAGLHIDKNLIRCGDMSEPNGYAAANDLMASNTPPTAFVASSIVLALGVRRAVEDLGLRPGRDISIACFDDDISYLPNRGTPPPFTTVRSSVRAAGKRCAELLIRQIETPKTPLPAELWDAELVLGASTGPGPFAQRKTTHGFQTV
jgi:LacI family transcriptional regulator